MTLRMAIMINIVKKNNKLPRGPPKLIMILGKSKS